MRHVGAEASDLPFGFSDNQAMSEVNTTTAPEVADLAKSDQNLVWIDCEMTGLDPEKERLLEIAVIVTGPHRDVGVQVEAFHVRMARTAGAIHRIPRIAAQAEHPLPGTRTRGHPAHPRRW